MFKFTVFILMLSLLTSCAGQRQSALFQEHSMSYDPKNEPETSLTTEECIGIGALSGLTIGILLGYAATSDQEAGPDDETSLGAPPGNVIGPALGAMLGGIGGGIAGYIACD